MGIFGTNTLDNLGEIEIKPFSGYVGDSGISRILYESENDHTKILSMIYESDFYELDLMKKGLVTEAAENAKTQIRRVRDAIKKSIEEFISKIAGWWDSFLNILTKRTSDNRIKMCEKLKDIDEDTLKISFKAGKNILKYCDPDKIYEVSVGQITDFNDAVKDIEKMDEEELREHIDYLKTYEAKAELLGGYIDPQEYINGQLVELLGEQVQHTEISKADAEKLLSVWKDNEELKRQVKKAKDKNIKFCKAQVAKFNKQEKESVRDVLMDQCLYAYFRMYREMVAANCILYMNIIKEIERVSKVVVSSISSYHFGKDKSGIEELQHECAMYEIEKMFEGELV